MGVGIGEAGGSPPSYSLISDYFPPAERGRALAIYSLGVPLGSMIGAFAGGRIAVAYGWRTAFYVMGVPGIILAVIVLLVAREPKRGRLDVFAEGATAHPPAPPLGQAIASFFANRTLVLTAVSSAMSAFVGYAGLIWNPQFLEVVKGMSATNVANYYALVLGVTGIIGTFGAGWLVDKLGHKDRRWFAWVPAIAFALSIPFWIGLLWAPTWQIAILFLAGPLLLNNMYLAPALTVVQNASAPAQRTMGGAILLFVLNIVGLGVGPVYVGWIADNVAPAQGDNALAYGFAAVIPMILLTIGAHLAAGVSIARDKRLAAALGS
jgi:MFS family permease